MRSEKLYITDGRSRNWKLFSVFLIFFLIAILLHFHSLDWKFNEIFNGGDIDYPINAWLEVKRSLSVWNGESLGVPEYFAFSKFLLVFPQLIIQSLVRSVTVTNYFYSALTMSCSGFFMYLLLRYLKVKGVALWVGSLFFMLNTYVYLRFHFPQPHLRYAYASLPLLVLIFSRVCDKSMKFYTGIGLFSLVMIAISRTANIYMLYWVLVPLIVYLIGLAELVKIRLGRKQFILFFAVSFLLNITVLLSYVASAFNYTDVESNSLLEGYRRDTRNVTSEYKLYETLAGFGTYAWVHKLEEIKPGFHTYDVISKFDVKLWILLAYIPVLYAFVKGLFHKRIGLLILALFIAVLANGFGEPFGGLYSLTFGNLPVYRDFFRDTWTYWMMPYFFVVSLLLALALRSVSAVKSKNLLLSSLDFGSKLLLITVMLANFIPLYIAPGKMINKYWSNKIPSSYVEMSKYIDENLSGEKILPLPLTDQIYGYTYSNWEYAGPDIMHRMVDVEYVDKFNNVISQNSYVKMLNGITEPNAESLNKFLNRTDIRWVLLRNDFIGEGDPLRVAKFKDILEDSSCWEQVKETDDLILYNDICNSGESKMIEVTQNYVYGKFDCSNKINVDKNIEGATECGFNPKDDGYSISKNVLLIETPGNSVRLDLSDGEYDLIENYDFEDGIWNNGEITTCSSDMTDNELVSFNLTPSDVLKISSEGSKVCLFEKLEVEKIGSSGIIQIAYKKAPEENVRFCVYYEDQDNCHFKGIIDPTLRQSGFSIKRENYTDGSVTDYIFIDELDKIKKKGNSSIFLYFNDSESGVFSIDIDQIRVVSTPDYFKTQLATRKEYVDGKDFDVSVEKSLFGGMYSWENRSDGNVVVAFNQNFNPQWKLIGWKNGPLPELVDAESVMTYDYANGWFVRDVEGYSKLGVVYLPQLFYLGSLSLTVWVYFCYLLFVVWGKLKRF